MRSYSEVRQTLQLIYIILPSHNEPWCSAQTQVSFYLILSDGQCDDFYLIEDVVVRPNQSIGGIAGLNKVRSDKQVWTHHFDDILLASNQLTVNVPAYFDWKVEPQHHACVEVYWWVGPMRDLVPALDCLRLELLAHRDAQ